MFAINSGINTFFPHTMAIQVTESSWGFTGGDEIDRDTKLNERGKELRGQSVDDRGREMTSR